MAFVYRNPLPKKYRPSLVGYKQKHQILAKEKGVEAKFMAAATLTEARKILFGK